MKADLEELYIGQTVKVWWIPTQELVEGVVTKVMTGGAMVRIKGGDSTCFSWDHMDLEVPARRLTLLWDNDDE